MIFLVLVTTLAVWLVFHHYRRVSRFPPGPVSLPLIGNLPQLMYYAWSLGGWVPLLNKLRKQYGNVFTAWFGPIPYVSIADFDTAHEVFVKHGSNYADRPVSPLFNEARRGYGIVSANGPLWQEIRRFSLVTFRNMGMGRDKMEPKIMEELDARCASVDKNLVNGVSVIPVSEFFDLTVGSIINSILMGKRFDDDNKDDFLHLKHLLDKGTTLMTPLDMILPVWMIKMFSKKRYDAILRSHFDIMDFLAKDAVVRYEDVIAGKITIDAENPSDYVDSFILKMQQEGSDKNAYCIPSLKSTLTDLWQAGQETTTTTLISGFSQLLNHPEVMEKARNELLQVTNNRSRSLSLSDRNETVYLNAVIAEIQRHASILNVSFWKVSHETAEVGGFLIDSGALITAQLSAFHSNETAFENPNLFDPERFIRNKELAQKLIPFGIGKRACTGESLARAELYLIIGNLLLRYKFERHEKKTASIDIAPFSFAKKPELYEMKFIKF